MIIRILGPIAMFILVVSVGTTGYWLIGRPTHTVMDALYMTVITISTIGFAEVIDVSGSDSARIFTMVIALSGIGLMTYIMSNLTANVVEGHLKHSFRQRKMAKQINKLENHFIICGAGRLATQLCRELKITNRRFVVIENDQTNRERFIELIGDETLYILGDATHDEVLIEAGIERSKGIFAATNDDNCNLIISLSAKHINPKIRTVARCEDPKHIEKMKKAGADSVVSPAFIGGLKMASDMVRSEISTFIEALLRDDDMLIRFEAIPLSDKYAGKKLSDLDLGRFSECVLIALQSEQNTAFRPAMSTVIDEGSTMVVFTTPKERARMEHAFT